MSPLGQEPAPDPFDPPDVDERHTNPSGLPDGDPKKVPQPVADEHHEPEARP